MRGRARRVLLAPLGVERDRLRWTRLPPRLRRFGLGARAARALGGTTRVYAIDPVSDVRERALSERCVCVSLWKGALRPPENDSAFLLDPHRRGFPGRERMRSYRRRRGGRHADRRCGSWRRYARPAPRTQRLEGAWCWRLGRSGTPTRIGSPTRRAPHPLYWTEERIIGGEDPVELGKNNCGRGVGGSMIHYAGYTPRFHPSDFEVYTRDGVAADWPISYQDLKPHYERLERELPVAGQDWPWGDPHGYPHGPHPIGRGGRAGRVRGARDRDARRPRGDHQRQLREPPALHLPRLLPAGLQGQRQGDRPLVTHLPDALEHGVEIRADCMVARVEIDEAGRCTGVTYFQTARNASRPPKPSPSPATRSRRHGCCCTPPAAASPTVSPTSTTRSGVRHGAGRPAGRRALPAEIADVQGAAAGNQLRAVLRDRPQHAGSRAASRSRPSDRCRSAGPSTSSPTDTGDKRCASTCATTTTGRRSALLCELLPRAENRVTLADEHRPQRDAGRALLATRSARTTARTSPTPRRSPQNLRRRRSPGHTHDRPLRPPRRRLRGWPSAGDRRHRRRPPRWESPTC